MTEQTDGETAAKRAQSNPKPSSALIPKRPLLMRIGRRLQP